MATKSATKPVAKAPLKAVPAEGEAAAEPKKKKPILLIVIALLVVLLGGGGATWYFVFNKPAPAAGKETKDAAKEAAKPPVFVNLEPFTVNLSGGEHYLQIGIVLQVSDEATQEAVKDHLPQIRNALLLLLSSKKPEDLVNTDGKQKLADEILADTRQPIGDPLAKNVQSVLFSSLVIQ